MNNLDDGTLIYSLKRDYYNISGKSKKILFLLKCYIYLTNTKTAIFPVFATQYILYKKIM